MSVWGGDDEVSRSGESGADHSEPASHPSDPDFQATTASGGGSQKVAVPVLASASEEAHESMSGSEYEDAWAGDVRGDNVSSRPKRKRGGPRAKGQKAASVAKPEGTLAAS